jgi:hypothetical protein
MDRDRLDHLISGYLAGSLSEEECAELARGVEDSPEIRDTLFRSRSVDRLLREAAKPPVDPERVIRALGSRGNQNLEEKIIAKLREETSRTGKPTSQDRPPTRRTRRHSSVSQDPSLGVWTLAAAGVFAVVMIFALLSPPASDPAAQARGRASKEAEVLRQAERVREQARADAERRRLEAEARLREIEEKRKLLAATKPEPQENPQAKERREKDIAELQRDKDRIEEELRQAAELAKKAAPAAAPVAPQEEKPPALPTGPASPSQGTTQVAVAMVEEVGGEASRVTPAGKIALEKGAGILAKDGLVTGGGASRLLLRFPDKTRLELGPDTAIPEITTDAGKHLTLSQGTIRAIVSKQPKDQPMIVKTPQGEAKVVGTTLRLVVDPDPKKGTRLEVEEGKVELKDLAGKMVVVESGHYAVVALGVELVAWPREAAALGRYVSSLPPSARKAFGDADWTFVGGTIFQRKVSTTRGDETKRAPEPESFLVFPYTEGRNFAFSARVQLDEVVAERTPGMGAWGFGLVVVFASSEVSFRTLQNNSPRSTEPGSRLDIRQGVLPHRQGAPDPPTVRMVPFQLERTGVFELKLGIERRSPRNVLVRGKLWQGPVEPETWTIEAELTAEGPVVQLGLSTCRCACRFDEVTLK